MKMKQQSMVAQVSQTLSELPDDQKTAVAEALIAAPGLSGAERRARLALRIAMARLTPAPKAEQPPSSSPAPAEPAPEPQVIQPEPQPEETPPPLPESLPPEEVPTDPPAAEPPAPEIKKPRKPAKVAMSTVRLEDAAMLLGAAFAAMDSETPAPAPTAAPTPAPETQAPETPAPETQTPEKPTEGRKNKPMITLPPFPDDL
jgi:hypothetical protein